MSLEQFKTQVLLLHSQQSTLDSFSAGFTDKYSVHCATSGTEALTTLGETPIHIIVSAQDLPGMSGLEALREAKKRSPETIGILLAGSDADDGLEALVGDQEVFEIVRGSIEPSALFDLVESAHKRARLMALAGAANDTSANVDEPVTEHIVMETSEYGATIISDGTGQFPGLKPDKIQIAPGTGGRDVDVLVLTKDEEFLSTIKDSARGLHNVHHAVTTKQADDIIGRNKIGVLVTDAAMSDDGVETLTQQLRKQCPRLVAIVAGRRDDGEMLMDLINRGHVYRFLLKPVSPGRARLAIEASVKHHMEAPDEAFKPKSGPSLAERKKAKAEEEARRKAEEKAKAEAEAKRKAEAERKAREEAERKAREEAEAKRKAEEEAKRKAEEEARRKAEEETKRKAEEEARRKAEEEAKRKAEEEAEAHRKAEEEARRKAEEEAEARRKAEEEAKAKAEAERKKREEAEAKAQAKAEAKARAKAEAEAKKKARAEAKARAKAEAEAKKQAKAAAKARAKAEAAARKQAEAEAKAQAEAEARARAAAERKIEPVISDDSFDVPFDDGFDGTFGETGSFTDTMSDIAANVGKSLSGAAGSVADGAHSVLDSLGEPESAYRNPKVLAVGGGAIAAAIVLAWVFMGGEPTPETPQTETAVASTPALPAPRETAAPQPAAFEAGAAPYEALLEEARAARRAGDLLLPATANALDLYSELRVEAAGDPVVEAEFEAVVNQVLSIAENAILAGNADQADGALSRAAEADPANSRLNFLRVQVNELLLRDRAERARAAIRDNRFEDAGRLISEARSFATANSSEIDLLSDELTAARNQQQVGDTIELANERLAAGNLVAPANDNARYYFELALSSDPASQAAQQGLIAVASKLVLQARTSIDAGQLDTAESLLDDAADIDASSAELASAIGALTAARQAIAEAERQAEAERLAEIERRQAAERREEERLQAEAAQRERDRIAEQQRQAAAAEQAESRSESQANAVATASPLGVGAAAPKPAPRTTAASAPASPNTATSRPEPESVAGNTASARSETSRQETTTVVIEQNPQPPARVQTQAASVVNVQSNSTGSVGTLPREPETLPISRFERINYVAPEYPRAARRRNITGAVNLAFTITTDGRVRAVSVIKSEPSETFDQAAIDAVEQWRFEPVVENGVAVEKKTAVRLSFSLE